MSEYSKGDKGFTIARETAVSEEEREQRQVKFVDVMNAVRDYEDAHSLGAMMAGAILGAVHETEGSERQQDEQSISLQAVLANMDKAEDFGLHMDIGERRGVVIFGLGKEIEKMRPGRIDLEINDIAKFVDFLHLLDKDMVRENQEISSGLRKLIMTLTEQMINYYRDDEKKSQTMLRHAEVLIAEFERLGLGNEINRLVEYFIYTKEGTLREFRVLNAAQCLELPGERTFGPSQWHTDMSADLYELKWKEVEMALHDALVNPKVKRMIKVAVANLLACIKYAREDIDRMLKQGEVSEQYKANFPVFIRVLDEYEKSLQQLQKSFSSKKDTVMS